MFTIRQSFITKEYLREEAHDNKGNLQIETELHLTEEGFVGLSEPSSSFHSQNCPRRTQFDGDGHNLHQTKHKQSLEIERSRQWRNE